MVGQDPARFRRSTTATRFPCEASDQAKNLALPLPSTTTSYSSGCDTFFPLRVNSSRSFHALAATISITTRNSGRTSRETTRIIPPGVRESLRSDQSLRSDRLNPYLAADSLPIISTISRHALAHSRHALAQRFMCSSSGNFSHSLPQLSQALAQASHTRTAIGP